MPGPAEHRAGKAGRAEPIVLVALLATASLPVLSATMLASALPDLADGLHVSATAAPSVVGAFVAAQLLAQPFVGALIHRMGFRRSLHGGMAVLALGSLLAMAAPTLGGLLAARVVQALGVAVLLPVVHAQLVAGRGRDGRRFGLLTSLGNVTAAVGPLLGGLLVARLGWRGVFATTGVIACVASGLLLMVHRQVPAGISAGAAPADLGRRSRALLHDRRVLAAVGFGTLDGIVLTMLLVGLPFVARDQTAWSPAVAMTALTVAGAIAAPMGGRLADRAGQAVAVRTGFLTAAAGLLALPLAGSALGAGGTYAALAVAGAGLGLEFPAVLAAPVTSVPAGLRAAAGCLAATGRHLGSLAGAVCVSGAVLLHPAVALRAAAATALIGALLAGLIRAQPSPAASGDRAPRSSRRPRDVGAPSSRQACRSGALA